MNSDTICALATPPGGAIGIIRLSGNDAITIACNVCQRLTTDSPQRTAILTQIIDNDGTIIDEAIAIIFHAPHSYTGEQSVELSCHGSSYILNKVIEMLIRCGARSAQPGEFTQRAFLNGKLDLSQAEAVADLIAANNKASHDIAISHLRGHFSSELSDLREQLLKLTSLIELELDFADHEELEFADRCALRKLTDTIDKRITHLAQSFEKGQAIKQGIPVAIVGKTNVGKSTLLNALVKEERAIVSDVHGTTRDTIEDNIEIHGIKFRFIDTAGIRRTDDQIEQIGINRAYQAMKKADIVLWLFDEQPTESEFNDMSALTHGRTLIPVITKADLQSSISFKNYTPTLSSKTQIQQLATCIYDLPISISAKTGHGLMKLQEAIYSAAAIPNITDNDVIITNARHYEALLRSHESLSRVLHGLNIGITSELLAEDLRLAINALADITGGSITPQETLNNIFSHFCVGK